MIGNQQLKMEELERTRRKKENWRRWQQCILVNKIEMITASGWLVKSFRVDPRTKGGDKLLGQPNKQ